VTVRDSSVGFPSKGVPLSFPSPLRVPRPCAPVPPGDGAVQRNVYLREWADGGTGDYRRPSAVLAHADGWHPSPPSVPSSLSLSVVHLLSLTAQREMWHSMLAATIFRGYSSAFNLGGTSTIVLMCLTYFLGLFIFLFRSRIHP